MKTVLISMFLLVNSHSFSQSANEKSDTSQCFNRGCSSHAKDRLSIQFFPDGLLFKPNFSNPFEAKIGPHFVINESNLQLDIGAAKDLIHYRHNREQHFGFGAEFFTWTMFQSQSNFKFPVITVDYFFGIYFSHLKKFKSFDFMNRLRIGHISAHLVDGSYDLAKNVWNNNLEPFVYSREFAELSSAIVWNEQKFYLNLNYLFHVIPNVKSKFSIGFGSELLLLSLKKFDTNIFCGFDLKLLKRYSEDYESDKSISAGIHFGKWNSSGLRISYQYYSGGHFHGELSNMKINRSSIGAYLIF